MSTMHQTAVTTAEECGIPGLSLIFDFVATAEEERALLEEIDSRPWDNLAKRRVQHYGRPFNYIVRVLFTFFISFDQNIDTTNTLTMLTKQARTVDKDTPAHPIPPLAASLIPKIMSAITTTTSNETPSQSFDQLTINEYPPGVGISPHVETHSAFGNTIACLSLASSAVMVFRREGHLQRSLLLPPRSLLLLDGEARLAWAHYIPHRKADVVGGEDGDELIARGPRRVSFTFRTVRPPTRPCPCPYPHLCDDQQGFIPPTRAAAAADKQAAQDLEDSNVNDVYNAIASHFSATRFAVWPAVRRFIESLPPGSIVADVGCGNGKYFGVRRDVFTAGSDKSSGLASVAGRRCSGGGGSGLRNPVADVLVADGYHLPYRQGSCDAVLCIAVLHHMATVERRRELLTELVRVLVPGGKALVTVWATEQENMKKVGTWEALARNDYLVPWHLPVHRAEAVAAATSRASKEMDSGTNALVFKRYYHLFEPGELEGLVREGVEGAGVVESFYDKDNWCVVMERKGPRRG